MVCVCVSVLQGGEGEGEGPEIQNREKIKRIPNNRRQCAEFIETQPELWQKG